MRTYAFANLLRKRMTPQEEILWQILRRKKFHGLKFRRQAVIGKFIVDFLCVSHRLVIELDGAVHLFQQEYDKEREVIIKDLDFKIIRFTNSQIEHQLHLVLDSIRASVNIKQIHS